MKLAHEHARWLFLLCIASSFLNALLSADSAQQARVEQDNQIIINDSQRIKLLYDMETQEQWRDVTDKVLASEDTPLASKEAIRHFKRRIIVFKYPSDGLWIKGFLSFTPRANHNPLLILYRWGNEDFALMNPGVAFATYKNYTVVSSLLRGGLSEGKDEFGGADVNDMKNLIDFLPNLADELDISLHPSCVFMLGPSRGGLEMFLTLARFPELQNRVNKIVALSAALDLHRLIRDRPYDIKAMLQTHFGLPRSGPQEEAWIAKRDPLNTVPFIKKTLPILIIQGTADDRINLEEGRKMVNRLKEAGNQVNYWEIYNGNHVLMNTPHLMHDIAHWLETNSPCLSVQIPIPRHPQEIPSSYSKNGL